MSSHYFKYQCQEVPHILTADSHKALLFQIYPKRPIQKKKNSQLSFQDKIKTKTGLN